MVGKLQPCSKSIGPTPKCKHTCETGYNVTYEKDKHYGKSGHKGLCLMLQIKGTKITLFSIFATRISIDFERLPWSCTTVHFNWKKNETEQGYFHENIENISRSS